MLVVRAEKVSKHYQLGKQTVQALNNIEYLPKPEQVYDAGARFSL